MGNDARTIKCVVWDLDNTLWDGVLLEEAVTLRPDAVDAIRLLDQRGILHSIASRNDPDLAVEKLQELGLADYFLCPQIGWSAKSDAIGRIAETVNLGLDSFAFIDDDPFERAEVTHRYPMVLCLDSRRELSGLAQLPCMTPRFVTEDQTRRRQFYQEDFRRRQAEEAFEGTSEDFLATLGMRLRIFPARESDLQRAEELTQRTHQLNSTGYTYGYEDLERLSRSPDHLLLVAQLEDRFGDYGRVGLALVETSAILWTLKLVIVSCRVISRGVGSMLLRDVMRRAKDRGARLQAEFRETPRNRPMKIAFRFSGFAPVHEENRKALYERDLSHIPAIPDYVSLVSIDGRDASAA